MSGRVLFVAITPDDEVAGIFDSLGEAFAAIGDGDAGFERDLWRGLGNSLRIRDGRRFAHVELHVAGRPPAARGADLDEVHFTREELLHKRLIEWRGYFAEYLDLFPPRPGLLELLLEYLSHPNCHCRPLPVERIEL